MAGNKRKFLILYLDTGAGHKTPATILMKAISEKLATEGVTDVEYVLENAFKKHGYGRFLTEKYYKIALNYIKGLYPITYDYGNKPSSMKTLTRILTPESERYLKKIILREQPTDIISFHFAVSPLVERLIKKNNWDISLKTVVTDPFTVPQGWFYRTNLKFYVFSERAKNTAIGFGVPEENVKVIPFLVNPKYLKPTLTVEEKRELKIKHGFEPEKKLLVICGGGEGLRGSVRLVRKCIKNKADFEIAVVAGRVKSKYLYLQQLKTLHPEVKIHVYEFINYLDELIRVADCVVCKAGASLIMENVMSRKPIIVQNYIHNQELGDMQFIVQNGVGFFIRKPENVFKKVEELFHKPELLEKIQNNYDKLYVETSPSLAAEILLSE